MIVWAIQNGGYDPGTWYWGALLLLAGLSAVTFGGFASSRISRPTALALGALGLYVAWSFASITWAGSPGDALQGSNRALLYLLVFALFAMLPWTPQGATAALVTFALGVGTIAVVLLFRLASSDHVQSIVVHGRLLAPTGYFNSSAALFTMGALTAIAVAARRGLPGLLRGALVAVAAAELQLAVIGQSRGWLFTLPLVVLATFALVRDRIRVAVTAVLPVAAALIPLHRLLHVYSAGLAGHLNHAASRAAQPALLICAATFVLATVAAWCDGLVSAPPLSKGRRRQLGSVAAVIAIAVGCIGAFAATHGHPFAFAKRQWHGFSHASPRGSSGSNFGVVGSGRYDFWRVSLDAVAAHPIGGLGQDNFDNYYLTRRRTVEEPAWTHSLEMRLLAHTGVVGAALFALFLVAAVVAGVRVRRCANPLASSTAGAAMLPLVVWVMHGSVDWFWEIPALAGPAFGFLGMAGAIRPLQLTEQPQPLSSPRLLRPLAVALGLVGVVAAVCVLGFPYLSTREVAAATAARHSNPQQALHDLSTAARLDPLSALPGQLGGTIALQANLYSDAQRRFRQAIARDRGGWFGWFGAGLAASAVGDAARAKADFRVARSINNLQPGVTEALKRVNTDHPLTPAQALRMLVLAS